LVHIREDEGRLDVDLFLGEIEDAIFVDLVAELGENVGDVIRRGRGVSGGAARSRGFTGWGFPGGRERFHGRGLRCGIRVRCRRR
jgi:hypothetical protein